ncbi:FUSC family protein [Paenibacillus pini]|uniref:Membrane protein n=1 Tax=Paenibacillus pini JCM 16418 TaxID=1236976 RepID=W7YHV5_9BACL|nr:FUSC family protein [Paenibacillus pini]GAF07163.1 membrane protein [Paenibacillus pini JCM 16418]
MGRQGKKSSFFVILLKQALEIKKTALPWNRAISAGLCLGLPSLIGYLMGNLPYGLLAGIGAFTYLYVGNEPYALRARKLFYTALGMSFSFVLGSLLAAYPVLSAFVLGMIGAVATFIFGALQFKGPAALFFVLNFALASGKTISPSQVLIEGTLVFLGGMLAWSIAMLGWLVNPHGPEIQTVRQLYKDLADLLKTAGSDNYSKSRHNILISMYAAEEAFAAKGFSTKENKRSRWLLQLFTLAHDIFQETDKWVLRGEGPLNPELAQVVGHVAKSITPHSKYQGLDLKGAVLHQEQQNLLHLVKQIEGVLQSSDRISVDDRSVTSVSVKNIFMGAMDKNSVVFLLSVRFGIILTIAALTAHAFNLNRSYWVPLSCAAVMLGSTVIATFHRAIQRSLGTIIGILVASAILWTRPEGFIVSIAIMLFTFFAELFIVRNYAIALLFVTPNALLMAETNTHIHNVAYFAGTRIMDVIVGSVIGLMGVLLIGRRSASSRVPYLMGRTFVVNPSC